MNKPLLFASITLFIVISAIPVLAQTTPIPQPNIYLPIIIYREAPTVATVPPATATNAPPTATPIPSTPTTSPAVCDCSGNTMNCSDFDTQAASQACHDHCLSLTGIDIHRLDQDGDGTACESLPLWITSVIKS